MRVSTVYACLCLCLTLTACAAPAVVPQTRLVEVPVPVPQPAACKRLRAVTLPAGSTAQDVIETQARVILEYESQIISCSKP